MRRNKKHEKRMKKLIDLTKTLRSKNAGPLWLTVDVERAAALAEESVKKILSQL